MSAVTSAIRQFTGSEWKVVLALACAGGFGTIRTIMAATALTKPTVNTAVKNLISRGMLVGVHAGYQLSSGGLQIQMEIGKKFFSPNKSYPQVGESYPQGDPPGSPVKEESYPQERNFFTDDGSLDPKNRNSLQNLEPTPVKILFTDAQAEVYNALFPLSNPKRTQIAIAGRLNAEQAKMVVAKWQQTRKGPGFLVWMLEQGPVPLTEEQQRKSYVEGDFSDYIEH